MTVGLIDVDGHNGFPNLALMKLSAWHKQQGDHVEWYQPLADHGYDRVYMSKIFTFTPDYPYPVIADEICRGGSGYKLYDVVLTPEQEHTFPDYSMYPDCKHAIGFMTRGCVRKCPWCVVPKKEGWIHGVASWKDIKREDSNEIVFLDNNVLACDHGLAMIDELGSTNIHVDFNQGMDARLIDQRIARMLKKLKWIRFLRMACDTSAMIPVIERAKAYLDEAGFPKSRLFSYALIEDLEEAYPRVMKLREMGIEVFAQPYINFEDGTVSHEQKRFARWVNHKAIFKTVRWEDYK